MTYTIFFDYKVLLLHWLTHSPEGKLQYAIQPTTRHHNELSRDDVIKAVADLVGSEHKVDLKNYDSLILINIFKNVCGISVVKDFREFQNYNLEQIQRTRLLSETKE